MIGFMHQDTLNNMNSAVKTGNSISSPLLLVLLTKTCLLKLSNISVKFLALDSALSKIPTSI